MNDLYPLIERKCSFLVEDLEANNSTIEGMVEKSRFLVVGGAGSIGQAVVKEIFKRNPQRLHVVDSSENELVELVRDLRSNSGYIDGDFRTFAIDCGSQIFQVFFAEEGPYDYVLNLSALKHVRSERDKYTLLRMIEVNILNTKKIIDLCVKHGVGKVFCVSTDKAANPISLMGATKRVMEHFLASLGNRVTISTARFANVAFSNGSLLESFQKRLEKRQPIVAPTDIERYFITPEEAGQICLFATVLGRSGEIFVPKLNGNIKLTKFTTVAENYLASRGFTPLLCDSEQEARAQSRMENSSGLWPCFFSPSDTSGEKPFEEFHREEEFVDTGRFACFDVVKNDMEYDELALLEFEVEVNRFLQGEDWTKNDLVSWVKKILPEFRHMDKNKSLDEKM